MRGGPGRTRTCNQAVMSRNGWDLGPFRDTRLTYLGWLLILTFRGQQPANFLASTNAAFSLVDNAM